ncbi:dynein regulatory complex subunit 3-like [Adelges cooleyi]|uniref:dynein regulatory complex subunit 3-like n=1 Tax=Adelges cooleyi TaxID=133065 RepID=UPI0021804551|nr:dynein regulatory complex subunit 3-like [Adelges cooleyi]
MDAIPAEKLYDDPVYHFYDPKFILSSAFIKEQFLKHQSNEEVARLLALEPHFDWNLIVELDLSMLGMLHITGLRLPTNVRRLKLAQNDIKKIEHLDSLVKLEHLDLSFNEIVKIENLDKLTGIKFLNLAGNSIVKIENLETNTLLEKFFINDNMISDLRQLLYLKRFKKLQCMEILDNPATKDAVNSRNYIVCRFPRLQYLNSVFITDQERSSAGVLEPKVTSREKAADDALFLADSAIEAREKETIAHKLAFVDNLDADSFVDYLFQNDSDGKVFRRLNTEVKAAYADYEKKMAEITQEVFRMGMDTLLQREQASEKFNLAYYAFEKKWTDKGRNMICEFLNVRYFRMKTIAGQYDTNEESKINNSTQSKPVEHSDGGGVYAVSVEVLEQSFADETEALCFRLHLNNFYMNKSIVTMIGKYEKNLEDILKIFLEPLVERFADLREVENDYSQALSESVKMVLNNPDNAEDISFCLDHFGGDRFAMIQATYKSTDKHMDAIYIREEKLNFDIKNWTKTRIDDLKNKEKKRYLMVCEEIANFREIQRQSFQAVLRSHLFIM